LKKNKRGGIKLVFHFILSSSSSSLFFFEKSSFAWIMKSPNPPQKNTNKCGGGGEGDGVISYFAIYRLKITIMSYLFCLLGAVKSIEQS
jgi:hypothetical protein